MDNQEINNGRRRFLTLATCGAGGVAGSGRSYAFRGQLLPHRRKLRLPVLLSK